MITFWVYFKIVGQLYFLYPINLYFYISINFPALIKINLIIYSINKTFNLPLLLFRVNFIAIFSSLR